MLALASNKDQFQLLKERPELMGGAVEEFLRWATPIYQFRRTAMRDVELHGQQIHDGDKVVMWFTSANRDETVFEDPYRFDVTRSPNEHVTFGKGGPHFCLGAWLARLELRVMFEELLAPLTTSRSPVRSPGCAPTSSTASSRCPCALGHLGRRDAATRHPTRPGQGAGSPRSPAARRRSRLDIRFAGRDPLRIGDHAGVVALPGIANPPDATEAIAATRSSLADALDRELPILAICLGAELLAEAAGAKSYSCPPQYGYWPVSLTDEGTHDPLLAGLPRRFDAFQAHGFATELPDGAFALAHAGEELQAFRVGTGRGGWSSTPSRPRR